MRGSSASSYHGGFDEDCPTVLPTPVAGLSTEDLGMSGAAGTMNTGQATPVLEKSSLTLKSGSGSNSSTAMYTTNEPEKGSCKDKKRNRETGCGSTRTGSTAIFEGDGTEESPYIVDWTENDPENPMRWHLAKKCSIVGIAGVSTLCVAYSSSAFAGGIPPMLEYFGVSQIVLTLGITFFLIGFAVGPMFWAPLSEVFGRRAVFLVAYGPFVLFSMGCALSKNIETLLILRLLGGTFGACPVTNSGGVTADLFAAKHRGLAMSLFAVAPFLGPALGPVISGFLSTSSLGWRSNFWLMTIFAAVCFLLNLFFAPETYAPVLLRRRAEKLSKETGHVYISALDAGKPKETVKQRFRTSIFRPFVLLFTETIVAVFAVYMAYIYSLLYATFASYPIVFGEMRGWSIGLTGLAFLGMLVGAGIGNVIYIFEDRRYVRLLEKNNGQPLPPEARLPLTIFGAICMPVSLFIFAFTSYPHVHWIGSILAGIPFGLGQFCIFLCATTYMLDTYLAHAASALAANAILRSILGSVFPLFIAKLYHAMGNVWASALMGFLALLGVPIPYIFWKYGPYIRRNSKYAPGHAPAEKPDTDQVDADARLELDRRESIRETEEEREAHVAADVTRKV